MSDQTTPPTNEVTQITFAPTGPQRKAKSAFWARVTTSGLLCPAPLTSTFVAQVTGSRQMARWFTTPGFLEWFSNQQEYSERMEFTKLRALDRLDEILEANEGKVSEMVSAIKLAFEVTGAVNKKQAEFLDKHISQMGEKELEAFLARRKVK
jgi:hypothetical protein